MKSRSLFQASLVLIFLLQTHCASHQTPPAPQNSNPAHSPEPSTPTYKVEIKGSIKPETSPPQESQPDSVPETESQPTTAKPPSTHSLPEPIPIPLDRLED